MREYKFRAWHIKDKKMLIGPISINIFTQSFAYRYKEVKLMQYTCLKDKNGTEIYEGDILAFSNSQNVYVTWGDFSAGYKLDGVDGTYHCMLNRDIANKCEVVGNIYENPEKVECNVEVINK